MSRTKVRVTALHAVAMAAGSIVPLLNAADARAPAAADAAARPGVSAVAGSTGREREPGGTGATFNLSDLASHGARMVNTQTITFADSPTVMVIWQEQGRGAPRRDGVSHFAISRDGARIDQVATTENMVRLRYASFDPLVQLPNVPRELRAGAENELFLVQFVGTPLDEMRAEIRAMGGSIERFMTDNTHIIRMGPETRAWVSELPFVRWVGDYHPAYRLDDEILAQVAFEAGDGLQMRFSIECMRRGMEQQQAIADTVRTMGGHVDVVTPEQFRMEVTVTLAQLIELVHRNEVSFIEPWWGPGGTDMDLMRQVGGAVPVLSGVGMLGQGVRGEIFDTGIINNHVQWNGQVPLINGTTATDRVAHYANCDGSTTAPALTVADFTCFINAFAAGCP